MNFDADKFLTSFNISFREFCRLFPKIELTELFHEEHDVKGQTYYLVKIQLRILKGNL